MTTDQPTAPAQFSAEAHAADQLARILGDTADRLTDAGREIQALADQIRLHGVDDRSGYVHAVGHAHGLLVNLLPNAKITRAYDTAAVADRERERQVLSATV